MEVKRVGKCVSERLTVKGNNGRKGEIESITAVQGQSSSTVALTFSTHDLSSIQNEIRGQLNLSLSVFLALIVCVTLCVTHPASRSDYLAHSQKEGEHV